MASKNTGSARALQITETVGLISLKTRRECGAGHLHERYQVPSITSVLWQKQPTLEDPSLLSSSSVPHIRATAQDTVGA